MDNESLYSDILPHARDLLAQVQPTTSFRKFIREVQQEAVMGNVRFNFELVDGRDMADHEFALIKSRGYSLKWNRACQWYEVEIGGEL